MTRLLAVLLSLSLLGGCGSRVHYAESAGAYQAAAPPTGARPEAMKASRMTGAIAAPASNDLPSMDVSPAPVAPPATNAGDMDPAKPGAKRKIVYTAHLGLRVPNKRNSADAVRQIVEKHGGFVQNSTLDDITFRVDPKEFDSKSFVEFEGDICIVPPNSFALARSVEYFRIPRNVLTICVGKSTYARCGIITNVTPFEPEWEGHVTLEISNTTPLPAKIYANEGICQVLFFEAAPDDICETSYKDKAGKYQRQTGVTLPRL